MELLFWMRMELFRAYFARIWLIGNSSAIEFIYARIH